MPRKPRIGYAGAVYHVMNRGYHGSKVAKDAVDERLFVAMLEETCRLYGWIPHAWVLMPNHMHLLVETPEGNLVGVMKWFLGDLGLKDNADGRTRYGEYICGRIGELKSHAGREGWKQAWDEIRCI